MLLYFFACWFTPEEVVELSERTKATLRKYPKHRIVMMCSEKFVEEIFRAEGVEAIFCNHNCLVDENTFKIDPHAVKKYDALYNATMSGYKRHQLAAKVQSLALITYRYPGTHAKDYEKEVLPLLAHATWLVDAHKDSEKALPTEVAAYCNQSRVGLCLSDKEGAMLASMEYLLCGLPVVTTKNIGGRDEFFEPEYVEWVEDDPDAVKAGVENVLARAPVPEYIRQRALAKVEEHRQRARDLLKDILPDFNLPARFGNESPLQYTILRDLGRKLREA
jgi:glycosyltransferase involved in cell wall biosynthesis